MKYKNPLAILVGSTLMMSGCLGPSKPTPEVLSAAFVAKYKDVMSGEIRFESVTVLGYKDRWAKARMKGEGQAGEVVEYFYWESGGWNCANLVDGMTVENAKQLKVPQELWPTKEELQASEGP